MNEAMSSTTASATPEDEVDNLIRMVADEHSLDVGVGMDELGAPATGVPQAAQAAAPEGKEDDLAARLAALHKG
jgi:charged multivesicular body protein 1